MWVIIKNAYSLGWADNLKNTIGVGPGPQAIMIFYHELGHLIMRDKLRANWANRLRVDFKTIAEEIVAWRIAKNLCPPEFWQEKFALKFLKTYFTPPNMWNAWTKKYCKRRLDMWRKFLKIGIIP